MNVLPMQSDAFWGMVAIVVAFVLFAAWHITLWYLMHRCPKCKRLQAMEQTGEFVKGGFLGRSGEEWKCRYCGHRHWKKWSNWNTGNG